MLAYCMFEEDIVYSRETVSGNSFSSNIYSAITVIVSGVITSESISNSVLDCKAVNRQIYPVKKKKKKHFQRTHVSLKKLSSV